MVKGENVEAEAEEIITDRAEIEESEDLESDEHGEITAPTDIEPIVIEDTGDLDHLEEPTQSEEPVDEQLNAAENTGDSTEPEVDTPIDSEENEEENETEVQGTE